MTAGPSRAGRRSRETRRWASPAGRVGAAQRLGGRHHDGPASLQGGRLSARRGTLHRDVAAAGQFTAQRIKAGRKHGAGMLQIGVIHITGVSDCVPVIVALRQGWWHARGEQIEEPVLEEIGVAGRQDGRGTLLAELHQHAREARTGHRRSVQARCGEATHLEQGRRFCREAFLSTTIQKWQGSRSKTKG